MTVKRSTVSSRVRRRLAFAVIAFTTAVSLIAVAQPKKPAPKPAPAAAAKKPGAKPEDGREGGAPLAAREERTAPASATSKDAGSGGAVLEARTVGDGGSRVFRFGEVEVEGRLKSPQIVYFLRRVRAEFAAGDLGHRSFLREMGETKNEPGF